MSVPQPFTVALTKGPLGLGLTLDAQNVVTALKPGTEAASCGAIQPGDRVLSLNGVAVSADHPVKSVAIDIADGERGTFVLLRGALPAGPAAATPQMPPAPPMPAAPPQFQYPPMAAPYAAAPAVPPPAAAEEEEDEDDALAKRLEMLKRA